MSDPKQQETRIWTSEGFVEDDPWPIEVDGEAAPADGRRLLSLDAFEEIVENASGGNAPFGVVIEPADETWRLVPHLDRVSLVAVVFPAFSDGRAFSHASLLRTRHGFKGEIRAVGEILIDQIPLMLRCGIDSFAVSNAVALKRLEEGRLPGIPLHYQPAAQSASNPKSYSWRRASRQSA